MQKFIHYVAVLASLAALIAGVWQDWGIWTIGQRMLISYLAFLFLGSFLSLAVKAIPLLEGRGGAASSQQGDTRKPDR